MKIEKKTWPDYFQKILDGQKNFDLRLADFEINVGDLLVLKEWDPTTEEYSGRIIEKEITYVLKTKELGFFNKDKINRYGFIIMSLK